MKKQILTMAIVLGLSMTTFAQGGLFHRGNGGDSERSEYSFTQDGFRSGDGYGYTTPALPNHNTGAQNQPAPVGSGIAVLATLGAAYLIGKKRREE